MANTSGTITSRQISRLSANEAAAYNCNTKFTVKYTDITAANSTGNASTVTIKLGDTPAIWQIDNCIVNVTTAVAGANAACTVGIGTGTNTTAILAAVSAVALKPYAPLYGVNDMANCYASATTCLKMLFTQVGASGNLGDATAGQWDVYLNIIDLATQRAP